MGFQRRVAASLLLLFIVVGRASAQEAPAANDGAKPNLVIVHSLDDQHRDLQVLDVVSKPVYETREKAVTGPDGVMRTVTETVVHYVQELRIMRLAIEPGFVREVSGTKLTDAQIGERLKPGVAVIAVPKGQKLAPAYRALFAPSALVIIFDPAPEITPAALPSLAPPLPAP